MLFSQRTRFAIPTLALMLVVVSFSAREARADSVTVTAGHYTLSNPFVIPQFISYSFDLQTSSFRAVGGEGDGPSQRSGSNCGYPCLAGATFNLDGGGSLFTPDRIAGLNVGGVTHIGYFDGTLNFITDSVTIPLDAGDELTLSAPFTTTGSFSFLEIDGPFTYAADVVGSGTARISLYFSSLAHDYEIRRIDYNFQSSPVPEPISLILLSTGLVGIASKRFRRRG